MGDFKDKHGKTRIGSFLETLGDVAKPLLNIAGELTGIDALNAIADNIKNSDVLTDVQKTVALDLLKLDIENEKERTKRHQTDMSSDSWLSKNIRPMSLIFLLIVITILAVLDSAMIKFNVADGYITLFTSLLLSAFGFYFIGRDINKMIINRKNPQ